MDDLEETIKEIAAKNGIAVSRDDPILILHTINDRLLDANAAAQRELLREFRSNLEEMANQWGGDVERKAERIVNAALTASNNAMSERMEEGGNVAAERVRDETAVIAQKLHKATKRLQIATAWNVLAATLAMFAGGLAFVTLL